MKSWLFAMALLFSFTAAAAPASNWEKLKARIIAEGVSTETQGGIYLTLTDQVELPPPDKGHHVDYLSTVGYYNSEGEYLPNRVESVSETWTVNTEGNWDIDQWLIMSDTEGELLRVYHVHLIESPTGSILAYDFLPTTPEENLTQWKAILTKWIE